MTDINELKSWIAHAEDDFESAKVLIRRKKPLLYSACFHAQQCAEKYMKGLLIFKDQDFPKVHDLNTLSDLCSAVGIFLGMDKTDLARLSAYAVMSRYPGDEPTLEETRRQLKLRKRFAASHAPIWD